MDGDHSASRKRVVQALIEREPERLSVLPHPYGILPSEGRVGHGSVMNAPIEWKNWIAPQILTETGRAIETPYRAARGETITPQGASSLALTMMGGGMGVGKAPPGSLGMFIGRSANTWDQAAAARAVDLERLGKTPREIWTETGTVRGPENALRQELSDQSLQLTSGPSPATSSWFNPVIPLSEGLHHPAFQQAYPDFFASSTVRPAYQLDAKQYPTWLEGLGEGRHQDPNTLSPGRITLRATSSEALREQMAHELQHAVQAKEGWSKGGLPAQFLKQSREEISRRHPELSGREQEEAIQLRAFERYRQLAGEIEARMTAKRLNLTPEERRATLPDFMNTERPGESVILQDHWRFPPAGHR